MSAISPEQHAALRQQIDESYQKARAHQERLKQMERRLNVTQTTLSGLSALVAGLVAAIGKAPGGNWRVICGMAAVLAFGATVTTVTQKQRSDPELLGHISECVGKLRSLRVAAIDPRVDTGTLSGQYQQVLMEYDRVEF